MTIESPFAVTEERRPGSVPETAVMLRGGAPVFVACWVLDLSRVRTLIDAVTAGREAPAGWVGMLLNGARIADLDERAVQIVGAPIGREGMIGQPVASFAPPESWTILAELIVAVAADRPDHGERSSPINSFMLHDAVLKVWGAKDDRILERVSVAVEGGIADDRSFWAVRSSEQRFRRLIHHLPIALLQVDARCMGAVFNRLRADGVVDMAPHLDDHPELVGMARQIVRVTDANLDAVRLFGARYAEDLIAPVDYLFAAAPESAQRVMTAHFEGKRSHAESMKLRTFDGRVLDIQLSVTFPTPPERLDVTLISLEDVTDRLRTEAQLRQLQADFSRAARIATLGELASSIAHEVNQPLSAIALNAETSLRWLSRDEPNLEKVRQLNARIADSARHASDIVQRIRGMAARDVPERVLLDLNEVVDAALLFVRHDLEARAIALSTDLAVGVPRVLGDRVQLLQVIVNLLVNAIQAIGQGGGVHGRIELVTATDPDGAVLFSIRDSGPGVAEENLNRVFDGFFTTKEDGMGIGLAVCQSIIAAHDGHISVANNPDGGARFRFSIPASAAVEGDRA